MKTFALTLLSLLFLVGCLVVEQEVTVPNVEVEEMKLYSNAFEEGKSIPKKFTCQGENVNPELTWEDAPTGTKSFALIVDDPDAVEVAGFTWIHWLVKDIPLSVRSIQENSLQGVEVENSFKKKGYGGPCPPNGEHTYFFKLYALNVHTLSAETSDDFYKQVAEHTLAEAVLTGTYIKE